MWLLNYTSAGPVPVRICPMNGYWSRVHSFDMNVPFMNLYCMIGFLIR